MSDFAAVADRLRKLLALYFADPDSPEGLNALRAAAPVAQDLLGRLKSLPAPRPSESTSWKDMDREEKTCAVSCLSILATAFLSVIGLAVCGALFLLGVVGR